MENNERKFTLNKKLLAIAAAVVVLAAMLTVLLWPSNIVSELKVEAGRESLTANEFRKEDKGIDAQLISELSAADLKTPGSYGVKVQYKNKTYECTVVVEDTLAPEGKVHNVSVYSGQSLKPEDFVAIINAANQG